MTIKEQIEQFSEDMINDLGLLVKHDSKRGDPLPGIPFGEGPKAVLDEALKIADRMGYKTKNLDNYCGYAEIGSGDEIIALVGHLDIVPAGDGWASDPFNMVRDGDDLYGRGVSDDKGGVVASLYALKLLQDSGTPLNKRIRVIMGCAEETGSECMKHYCEVEEPVTYGFTPDGSFPGVFGEKGMLAMLVSSKKTNIISMNGGFVSNAVCSHCVTVVPADAVDAEALRTSLAKTPLTGFEVTASNGELTIEAQGVAAHASTPNLGVNAAICTMHALKDAGMKDAFVDYYVSHFNYEQDGAGFGMKCSDNYGDLTLNQGIVKTEDGVITCTIDIRIPLQFKADKIIEMGEGRMEDEGGKCEVISFGNSLFFEPDCPMVDALYSAYRDVTGDTESPLITMGGGTYAKSVPGIIAFGCEFPNTDNHIHDVNEHLSIREFKLQVEIYEKAIRNLLAL